jgi:hypothetical protein
MRRVIVSFLMSGVWSLMSAQLSWADPAADVSSLRDLVQQLSAQVQELTTTVRAQQQRLAQLEGPRATPVAASRSGSSANLSAFNPEIGVLTDIVGQVSESGAEGEGNDKISAREVELVFGHPIDPYSRLDITATFSDFEEASLEEAYITHWGLPGELKARLGRLRPKVGKASPLHRDSLDTVDEPLVVSSYLGAEGLSRTAAELSGFLPVPWTAVTHELTAGVMEGGVGEGGSLFGETRRRPSFYAHLKNFWDVSDATNVELGGTYLLGSKDADASNEVNALGLDATLVHYVTPTNKLKWQNELYLQDRDESFLLETDDLGAEVRTELNNNPWGWYSLLDYRLGPRLGIGGRFDYVEPIDLDPRVSPRDADTAWAGYLTFYQSEFARWRLQYKHTNFATGGDDNTVFLQGTFAIGVHKHQLQ